MCAKTQNEIFNLFFFMNLMNIFLFFPHPKKNYNEHDNKYNIIYILTYTFMVCHSWKNYYLISLNQSRLMDVI
jgi:hypothetical protein